MYALSYKGHKHTMQYSMTFRYTLQVPHQHFTSLKHQSLLYQTFTLLAWYDLWYDVDGLPFTDLSLLFFPQPVAIVPSSGSRLCHYKMVNYLCFDHFLVHLFLTHAQIIFSSRSHTDCLCYSVKLALKAILILENIGLFCLMSACHSCALRSTYECSLIQAWHS